MTSEVYSPWQPYELLPVVLQQLDLFMFGYMHNAPDSVSFEIQAAVLEYLICGQCFCLNMDCICLLKRLCNVRFFVLEFLCSCLLSFFGFFFLIKGRSPAFIESNMSRFLVFAGVGICGVCSLVIG
jgi:hypothetical protein